MVVAPYTTWNYGKESDAKLQRTATPSAKKEWLFVKADGLDGFTTSPGAIVIKYQDRPEKQIIWGEKMLRSIANLSNGTLVYDAASGRVVSAS